jgi:glycosyltransferase involved in cell wall biosynthesis
LMFVEFVWQGTWYSRHHLISRLARNHRVMIAEPAVGWRETIRRPTAALQGSRITADEHNVLHYHPPRWLPEILRGPGVRRALTKLRGGATSRSITEAGARNPIRYVWHAQYAEAALSVRGGPLVYHCYDKYDRYENAPAALVQRLERSLVRESSLCVAASSELAAYLNELGSKRTIVLPHGVDTQLFYRRTVVPPQLERIQRPIIGIVGSMTEVLDVATLRHVAMARPDWSLVLVGAALFTSEAKRARFDELCQLTNVHHMGVQPREDIPAWLSGFDVGLICYDRTAWGAFNQPIKMYEYLACGLPVVSTDITAARELADLVRCCDSADEWIIQIEAALREESPELAEKRVAFAAANSWDRRVAVLEAALLDLVD